MRYNLAYKICFIPVRRHMPDTKRSCVCIGHYNKDCIPLVQGHVCHHYTSDDIIHDQKKHLVHTAWPLQPHHMICYDIITYSR